MKTPNMVGEIFLSIIKWFLIIFIINNIIWAGIFIHYVNKSVADTPHNIEMTQDGQDNNQSITNG